MKKRIWVVGGSIGAVVLLMLMTFPTVASAQAVKSNEIQTSIFQHIKEKLENKLWFPGYILLILLNALILFIAPILYRLLHY